MSNNEKEKINANIDNAYEKQTDKVRELFEFAKNRIETEEKKEKKLSVNDEKTKKTYKVKRLVKKETVLFLTI